jgi:hypothetical protein
MEGTLTAMGAPKKEPAMARRAKGPATARFTVPARRWDRNPTAEPTLTMARDSAMATLVEWWKFRRNMGNARMEPPPPNSPSMIPTVAIERKPQTAGSCNEFEIDWKVSSPSRSRS